jgi:hypothetical protein
MKLILGTVALFLMFLNSPNAEIAIRDTFVVTAGFSQPTGMSGGSTAATEVLDSIIINGDTTRYAFSIIKTFTGGFFEMGGTMKPLIYSNSSDLAVLRKTPSNIGSHSSRFDNAQWVLGARSDFLFYPDLQKASSNWSIPLNTTGETYALTDYYMLRISDTIGVKWMRDTLDNRAFFGKVTRYQDAHDTVGIAFPDSPQAFYRVCGKTPSWKIAGGAGTAGSNPFNLLNIGASSATFPLSSKTMSMGVGCYGTDITKYSPGPSSHTKVFATHAPRMPGPNEATYYNLKGQRINYPAGAKLPMVFIKKMNGPAGSKLEYGVR